MSDPRRLVDQGADDFERSLLRADRLDEPPASEMRQMLAGVGIGAGILGTATSSGAATSAGAAVSLLAKWGAVTVAIGVIVTAESRALHPHDAPPSATAKPEQVERGASVTQAVPAITLEIPSPAESIQASPPRRRSAPQPSAAPALVDDSLPSQIAALDAVRRALAAHDAASALTSLDRFRHDFPKSPLAPETVALRVEALVQRGSVKQASALAKRFVAAHPTSPLAGRVERLVGGSTSEP